MTALPNPPGPQSIDHLLSIDEYAAIGEIEHGHIELQEGRLVMSPSPTKRHTIAMGELFDLLRQQLPEGFVVFQEMDIDLELAPRDQPGFARRPDVTVAYESTMANDEEMLRASEVVLVVEIVSPGSRRTDHVVKRGEYADAGIPHYWIIETEAPISLQACHLAEGFGYQDTTVTGEFVTTEPFDVRLPLDELMHWRGRG